MDNKPTLAFVALVLVGLLGLFVAEVGIPTNRLLGYGACMLVELWAVLNKRKGDTISEAFWQLSSRPLLPWMSGVLTTYFIMNGTLTNVIEICALVGIQSHFFWQSDSVYRRLSGNPPGSAP